MATQGPDPSGNPPAPFLSKCYDMVNDASTEVTVSWSPAGDTFVVWDPPAFSRDLLPKYFKHGNFSSFVRQLNTYGFRKVDPDRWEFANEGFRKGQKNLLKSIARRKQTQSLMQQKQLSHESTTPVGACVEVGKFGLEEEIEGLKRDKNVLAQELVKLRQHQQSTDLLVRDLRRRVQGMEQHQQQMLSFFVMAMQRPGFFAQLLQQNDRLLSDASKKRRLPALEQGIEDVHASAGGQIVKYEPLKNENSKPLIMPVSDSNLSPAPVPSFDGANDLFENIDWASLGIDMSLPMEVDVHSSEADGTFVFLEISNDELEQLLMTTSYSENSGEKGPGILEPDDYGLQFEASEKKTPSETPQNLDLLTERMGHLTSELNRDNEPA
ncbi:hypothetical protein AAC387_Pa02g5029 [Persea americana]